MKKNSILEKLTDINDELIIDSVENQQKIYKKKRWSLILKVVAGFLIIMVSGAIVIKATDIHVTFLEKFSGKEESKYSVTMNNEKIAINEFSEELQREREVILQQLENAKPWDNQMPTHLQRQFPTQKDVITYIGYKELKEFDLGLPEKATSVSLLSDSSGNIICISMESFFQKDDINIQILSNMYTEYSNLSDKKNTIIEKEYTTYEEETITIGADQWLVVTSEKVENKDRINKEAYTIKDKVEYNINMSYNYKDLNEAENLLKKCY